MNLIMDNLGYQFPCTITYLVSREHTMDNLYPFKHGKMMDMEIPMISLIIFVLIQVIMSL